MSGEKATPLEDGTLYSKRKGFNPLHVPPLKEYAKIVGEEPIGSFLELFRDHGCTIICKGC